MKYIKGILWAILLVTFGIGFTEEWLWGPNPRIRFALGTVHYGTMPFMYLVYLVQGILRNRSDRMGLVRFVLVYHVRNVPLFVVGWIAAAILIVLIAAYAESAGHSFSGLGPIAAGHAP